MKYYVITDGYGYVQVIKHTGTKQDFLELDLSDYDFANGRMNAYKMGKNELIFDPVKWQEIQDEQQRVANEKRIAELKQNLADTDYIVSKWGEEIMQIVNRSTFIDDMITINARYDTQYQETIVEREEWREEIRELEELEMEENAEQG